MLNLGLSYRRRLLYVCRCLIQTQMDTRRYLMAFVFVDRDASCCDALLAVRIPLFAIHAEDDPVGSPFLRLTKIVLRA